MYRAGERKDDQHGKGVKETYRGSKSFTLFLKPKSLGLSTAFSPSSRELYFHLAG